MRIASTWTELSAIWSAVLTGGAERMPTRSTRSGSADGPLQGVHAAHRAAEDRGPHVDAERVGEADLRGDLVADRQVREARRPLVAVGRDAGGPGRALASAQHVRRDDEPAVGVDRRAGADDVAPPAVGRMPRPGRTADVAVAGEGVQDEHGVVARRR